MSQITRQQMLDVLPAGVMKRILTEGRMPFCIGWERAELERVQEWFTAHPDAEHAFVFYDGRIIEEYEYERKMTSRTAQLVAIATDGWPVLVSRWAIGYCLAPEEEGSTRTLYTGAYVRKVVSA